MSYAAWTGAASFWYHFKKWARIWRQDQDDFEIPPLPRDIVTLGPAGEEAIKKGVLVVLLLGAVLALSDSK